jgi:hypothetical protein
VAVESAGRQIPMAYLERVKEDFSKRYGGGRAATAAAKSLNKEFGYLFTLLLKIIVPLYYELLKFKTFLLYLL